MNFDHLHELPSLLEIIGSRRGETIHRRFLRHGEATVMASEEIKAPNEWKCHGPGFGTAHNPLIVGYL